MFQPYARFWLEPLIQLLVTGGDNEGMHYLVVEVVVTMLTWAPTAIPDVSHMVAYSGTLPVHCVGPFYGFPATGVSDAECWPQQSASVQEQLRGHQNTSRMLEK